MHALSFVSVSVSVIVYMHTHPHTRTRARTYTRTHEHTSAFTHTASACVRTRAWVRLCARFYACARSGAWCVHAFVQASARVRVCVCVSLCLTCTDLVVRCSIPSSLQRSQYGKPASHVSHCSHVLSVCFARCFLLASSGETRMRGSVAFRWTVCQAPAQSAELRTGDALLSLKSGSV